MAPDIACVEMTESVADVKSGDDVDDRTTQTRQFPNDFKSVCCLVARKARTRRRKTTSGEVVSLENVKVAESVKCDQKSICLTRKSH